jgi:hypothetical protein
MHVCGFSACIVLDVVLAGDTRTGPEACDDGYDEGMRACHAYFERHKFDLSSTYIADPRPPDTIPDSPEYGVVGCTTPKSTHSGFVCGFGVRDLPAS